MTLNEARDRLVPLFMKVLKSPITWISTGGLAIAGAAAIAGASVILFMADPTLPTRAQARLAEMTEKPQIRPDKIDYTWETLETGFHTIEKTIVELGEVDGSVTGGGLASWDDSLIYLSANGRLGFIEFDEGTIAYTDSRVPMDFDEVRKVHFQPHIGFNQNWYRVQDALLIKDDSGNEADLYVAHHKFTPEDGALCINISHTRLKRENGKVSLVDGVWNEIIRTTACTVLEDYDWRWAGHITGGRLVSYDDDHVLLSTGSFALGNFYGRWDLVQPDSGLDLAKILKVNVKEGTSTIYAAGVRNPQGLAWDEDGLLWESEHGAQSGDEVNVIVEGGDYGWPNVANGFDYGTPRAPLPLNPVQGRHDGYVKPAMAYVPTIGTSQIVPVKRNGTFKLWGGDLLLLTLKDRAIHRLRTDGPRVVFDERIDMEFRQRDGLQMDNGWIVMLTDINTLVILRDPEQVEEGDTGFSISGYDALKTIEAESMSFEEDYPWGRMLFSERCGNCHLLNGETKVGPPLNGVIGRDIAALEEYPYTDALLNMKGKWTKSKIRLFMQNPEALAPGTSMVTVNARDKWEREAIADYLAEIGEEGVVD